MSMTQDAVGDKTPDRNAFLRALFAGAPDNLYLEMRCIHPKGPVSYTHLTLPTNREV